MKINGATIVLETLKRLGVTDIFGYPGGAVIPIYDALYDFEGIKHYLVRHEQGAAHAADGYARTKNKVGVCIATSGPGATNLVTGIMTSYMDSIPILAITGQVSSESLGKDSFQESDICGITAPITKHNYLVKTIQELPRIIREAYSLAKSGRPGPVLVDIPKDIQLQKISIEEFEKNWLYQKKLLDKFKRKYIEKDIEIFRDMILESEKPVFILGGGILSSGATKTVKRLLKRVSAPSVSTLMGMGVVPSNFPGYMGMIGMHGIYTANKAVEESDLVIAIGMRFDDRIVGNKNSFAKNAKIIHLDIDEAEIGKNIIPDFSIIGDAREILNKLLSLDFEKDFSQWKNSIFKRKTEEAHQLNQVSVLNQINTFIDDNTIIVTDVGQHQMFAAQHLKFGKPYNFCSSSGAGTMGYGIPAAIGAQIANPDKKVIAIVGDGGFQMTQQELILLKQYSLPVKVIILNNNALGMVRQWQELFHNKRFSQIDLSINPDFMKLADAYGIESLKISDQSSLSSIEEAIKNNKPMVIEVLVSKDFNVYPIIPPGKDFKDTLKGA
ncbi:MAG: biosynthetic-type acetolactate synthase large subunit [Fusobacteriaceae bacterium]